jgi:hypothetical protein
VLAENVDQTVRARTRTVKVAARPDEGQIDLMIGGTTYRYFVRLPDPAALPAATAAKLAEIQASTLVEIQSVPYGDYRKVTKLTLVAGTDAEVAAAEKALPRPYNGCSLKKKLAASVTAREAYELAAAEARAWQGDSAPRDADARTHPWTPRDDPPLTLKFFRPRGAVKPDRSRRGHALLRPSSNRLGTFEVEPDVPRHRAHLRHGAAGGGSGTPPRAVRSRGLINNPARRVLVPELRAPGDEGGGKTIIVNARTGLVR